MSNCLLERYKYYRYKKAMFKALERASEQGQFWRYKASRTNCLRAIKRFEKINSIKFDPYDEWHLFRIDGAGCWENLFRSLKLKKIEKTEVKND